ncbi:LPS export ABC transporter periplasmic protein LptC [Alcanivorax sp. S6407]|uniref:LPS export ABC transporter periplasmic protein LptC n=1 Tax=Alcanivorax sp. S6407 TaxID=2926424 RepID=UPI001FF65C7A|nr:LPS export ABC transporter periplasmic protein LptC [Alcanivorax sp. S6407]MCK0154989.1 LPS export ABC transporter periplasmic protein LptC [Alcanivorax sp. S6407]
MKRQGLLSATGILLLGLVVLMTLHEWDTSLPGEDQAVLTAPAIIARQISARAFNEEDGSLQYHLIADNLLQYDHNPLTEMARPRLAMANEQGTWTISSDNGTVQDNGKLIVFSGSVEARNPDQKIELDTDELRFDSDTNIATSPADATLRFESGETRAGSLEADLDKGILSLDQGVKSEFNAPAS